MKKFFSICILLVSVAFTLCFAFTATATASNETKQTPFYLKLNSPAAISSTDVNFAVSDANGVYLVGENGVEATIFLDNVISISEGKYALTAAGNVYALDFNLCTCSQISVTESDVIAIAAKDSLLAVATNTKISEYAVSNGYVTLQKSYDIPNVSSIAYFANELIYSVTDGAYSDIMKATNGAFVYYGANVIGKLFESEERLYGISSKGEVIKIDAGGGEAVSTSGKVSAMAKNGIIYTLSTDGEAYAGNDLIFASASDEQGFYRSPTDVYSRFGSVVVADYYNNRVEVSTKDSTSYFTYMRPYAVALDHRGGLIVAHSANKLFFAESGKEYTADSKITDIETTPDGTVYFIAGGKLYSVQGDSPTLIKSDASAISVSTDGLRVKYASGTSVYDLATDNEIFQAAAPITAVAEDANGTIFALVKDSDKNSLYKYTAEQLTQVTSVTGKYNAVAVSRTAYGKIGYGDVLIADAENSLIKVVSSQDVGTIVKSDVDVSDIDEENIVYSTVCDCYIYSEINESSERTFVKSGTTVLVSKYDLTYDREFAYAYVIIGKDDSIASGYIHRSVLTAPQEYVSPPANYGTVFVSNTPIYTLPSIHADKAINSVPKDTTFALRSFADFDNGGKWYRVELSNGKSGYVKANGVSIKNHFPNGERPQYNATITEHNGSVGAKVYAKIDDITYTAVEGEFLLNDTRVEIVGVYDVSQKYTLIRYYDEKLGTAEAYVETIYLSTENYSIVQIAAIAVIAVTVILLAIVVIKAYSAKRKL